MNEALFNAQSALVTQALNLANAENVVIETLKDVLEPCGEHGCPIGTEDYDESFYYVNAEPEPNITRRVLAVRYNKESDRLEYKLDLHPGDSGLFNAQEWMPNFDAGVSDFHMLLDEVRCNLEYCNGYQDTAAKSESYLIDEDGSTYDPATSKLSGGMDSRCDENPEAIYALNVMRTPEKIDKFLTERGWALEHDKTYLQYRKGNTIAFFDDYQDEAGCFACFGTEYKA